MPVKGKYRRRSTKSKLRSNRTHRNRTYRNRTHRKQRRMRGGNYEKDVTTGTLEGTAIKPLNKIVVALPGYGTMSGSAYVRLMMDIDRNGKDIYD
uniref:Uncharacterized protein n=1 Tax=viral metagenome TaxID=1070528 RepID=A0A6C0DVF0_9ZZZZ